MRMLKITIIALGFCMGALSYAETVWQGSATLIVKPEKLEEFKKAVAKISVPTRKEPGCITYYGYQLLDDKGKETNRFEFHEIWTSEKAMMIDHKEKAPHIQRFYKEIKADTPESYLESSEIKGRTVRLLK